MQKKIFKQSAIVLSLLTASSLATADILISEYVRGASTKDSSIELYNSADTDYIFTSTDILKRYKSDGTTVTLPLWGKTINAKETLVLINGASNLASQFSATDNVFATGNLQIQSGEAWTLEMNGVETDIIGNKINNTWGGQINYRRQSTELNPNTSFNVSQWDAYPSSDTSDLGSVFDDTHCDQSIFGETGSNETVVHVDASGYVCANGTLGRPFKSLAAAQQAVKDHRAQGQVSSTVAIELADGDYFMTSGLVFDGQDSSAANPLILRSSNAGGATLSGGVDVSSAFTPLQDGSFKQALVDQNAASNIVTVDLAQLGIDPSVFDDITVHGYALEAGRNVAPAMLYSGGEKMTLARWPNTNDQYQQYLISVSAQDYPGQVSYDTVTERGYQVAFGNDPLHTSKSSSAFATGGGSFTVAYDQRIAQWSNVDDIFLDGVLGRSWEWTYNKIESITGNEITITRGEISGILSSKPSHFHYENIAEELDVAGEFYLDRQNKILYFYPTAGTKATLSVLKDTMLTINGANHLSIEGIKFESGRGNGIEIKAGSNNTIEACEITQFGLTAVSIKGSNNIVKECHIRDVGASGIIVNGGSGAVIDNTGTLVSHDIVHGNNQAVDNTIHDFAYDQKSQVPGIYLSGVGNTAKGNEIYNGPHFGVMLRHATDNTVEANKVHNLPNYFKQDGGAIYFGIGKFPYMRGNKVVNNLIEDVPTNGVYVDNFSSGVLIENNLFNNVGNHHHSFSAININGGGQNEMYRNLFNNSARPIKYNKFAETNLFNNYKNSMLTAQAAFNGVGVANTDYDKYPGFKDFLNYDPTTTDLLDFKQQASNATGNVSYNDQTVVYDSSVYVDGTTSLLTGIILPAHGNWEQSQNIALDSLTSDLSTLWSNVDSAFNVTANWSTALSNVLGTLDSTLDDIYTVGLNGGTWPITNLLSNGDFENGTSPWSAMKRQGQWSSLQTEQHNSGFAMRISHRMNAGHSAKYVLTTVTANQNFVVTADLNTTGKISIIYRYKDTSGSNRTVTVGWQDSDNQWINYNQTFTLPTDADTSHGIELWFKTGNSANQSGMTDILVDNVIVK